MDMQLSPFQLVSQRILGVNFSINEKWKPKPNLRIKVNSNIDRCMNDDQTCFVKLVFDIFPDNELISVPFKISVVAEGLFKWDDSLESDLVDKLLSNNAPAVLMSYIRPIVSMLTAFSGQPSLIIPLIDFRKPE